jgi:hypothetical protein
MALIILAVGSLIVTPTVALAGTSLKYHQVVESNTTELYAADSGIQYALYKLAEDPDAIVSEDLPSEVNNGTVNISTLDLGGGLYKITSTAVAQGTGNTQITSYIQMSGGIFEYGMLALKNDINMGGNAEITSLEVLEGNIYSNRNIIMSGNSKVYGNATAVGEVQLSGNAHVYGSSEEDTQPKNFTEIDTSVYLGEANAGGTLTGNLSIGGNGYYDLGPKHITGNLTISSNRIVRLTGTVWVDGTISMSGNTRIEGPGTIIAIGNITATGNSKLLPDNIPFIISTTGNISTAGNSWTSAAFYAPNGDVLMTGNSRIYGCVIGQGITAEGNNKVEYVSDLSQRDDLPSGGGTKILTWQIQ